MRHPAKLALLLLLPVLACATRARAQPPQATTLTDGFVSVSEFGGDFRGGGGLLVTSADGKGGAAARGFKIRFAMSDMSRQHGLPRACLTVTAPCEPGRAIPTSGRFLIGNTVLPSPAIIGGGRYRQVFIDGQLDFTGESVVIPDSQESVITLSAPVLMTGALTVWSPNSPAILFKGTVAARGRALLRFHKAPVGYYYVGITYLFEDPATAPPPPLALSLRAWLGRTAERVGQPHGGSAKERR